MTQIYTGVIDMARPKLESAKRAKIELRVNAAQKAALQAGAARAGLPTATWIIKIALEAAGDHPSLHSSSSISMESC